MHGHDRANEETKGLIPFIPPANGGTGDWVDITGTEVTIGTGRKNTALILATDANAPAAKACNEYSNNGKTDWFLPSRNELDELYYHRALVSNIGTGWYWSSSQNIIENAWHQRFSDGYYGGRNKHYAGNVRAIRAF